MRGHITQRTKGSWTIRVELPRDPITEKRRQKTVTINGTKKEAEAQLAQLLVEIGQGYHVDAENMTVGQYLERWIDAVGGDVRPNTRVTYSQAVKAFSPLIGQIPLRKLTSLDIKQAVNKLQNSGKLSAGTVKLYLNKIKIALEQAVDWDFIPKNQAKRVKSAKYEKPEAEFWTEEEAKLFMDKTVKYRYYSMWWLDLHSGLREGEIIGLAWRDIDLEKGLVHVRRTVTPYGINDPKSNAGNRTVPIDPETVKVMKKHRKAMQEETLRRGDRWDEGNPVFTTSTGKRLCGRTCRKRFAGVVKATGMKEITFHGLRHTYATILLRRGVNINKIAKVLGHADVSTLLNTYTHALPEDDDQVIKAIRQALGQMGQI